MERGLVARVQPSLSPLATWSHLPALSLAPFLFLYSFPPSHRTPSNDIRTRRTEDPNSPAIASGPQDPDSSRSPIAGVTSN